VFFVQNVKVSAVVPHSDISRKNESYDFFFLIIVKNKGGEKEERREGTDAYP